MAKKITRTETATEEKHAGHSHHDHSHNGHGHDHKKLDRFPTAQEIDEMFGNDIREVESLERAAMAIQNRAVRLDHARWSDAIRTAPGDLVTEVSSHRSFISAAAKVPIGTAVQLGILQVFSIARRRINQKYFTSSQRDRFNRALQQAHNSGQYQALADIHSEGSLYRMHSMAGAVGTQRFLPWHRVYLLKFEQMLRTYEPAVRIPYWDYANDRQRPDWVWQPPGVTRDSTPGNGYSLPTQATVDSVLNRTTYTSFTSGLENNAHNDVHNWSGGSLMSPATSANDPIFFLLHANVDRIWDQWQLNHNGTPVLSGADAIMDPWTEKAADVDSVLDLGYWYF